MKRSLDAETKESVMDNGRMARMAQRIAQEEEGEDDALAMVDAAVDGLIVALEDIDEYLPQVEAQNDGQKQAKARVRDLVETALAPYTADVAKAMQAFAEPGE